MIRALKITCTITLLFLLTACVSRYSTSQYGNKVVLKDNEMQQELTTITKGARFLGKIDRPINGIRMKAFVYEKGKDYILVGVTDTQQFMETSMYTQAQDPNLVKALKIQTTGLDIRNFPYIDRSQGGCALGLVNAIEFNDKMLLAIYLDNSSLSPSECGTVNDIEGFYGLYPERAERFIIKASEAIEITKN
ncbi:hypothetical protein [Pseudodesulfovibrio portus]|uniref:Lipoprotein n=1 Tax=Pseudodesulfovibrio portus TaxID=231439 RepID=A0ABN6S186_9BACT|nr:hypothetical protein [Pseudodesulfovibrio portus]BDQ35451.1 hypothetical protein JCM14722_29930 [Pseudodesulfovibrio portus]